MMRLAFTYGLVKRDSRLDDFEARCELQRNSGRACQLGDKPNLVLSVPA